MARIIVITSGKGGVGKSLGYSEYVALSNGDVIQIGPYIDNLLENNKPSIKQLLVQTTKGTEIFEVLEPPQNLTLNIVKNPSSTSLASEINKPIALMRKPAPKNLIRIKTPNGPIEVTEEHKFITIREGNLIKLKADELTNKDYLLEFNYPITSQKYERKSKNTASLLGYLIGDGYLEPRKDKFVMHIFSEKKNKKYIENLFMNLFGEFKTLTDKRTGVVRTSYFKTERINTLISEYKIVPATSEKKEIPKKIFNITNEECSAFLSALFDCDGHVCKNKNTIEYDSKSEKLIYQIVNLLRTRFKIKSQIKESYKKASNGKGKKQKYFRIDISGEDILKFHYQVGFNIKDKKKRLNEKIINQPNFNTNIKLFPVGKLLKTIRNSSGITAKELAKEMGCTKQLIYEYEWGFYALSANSLKNFLETFKKKNISHEKIEFLENLIKKGYSFRKIQKIERIPYNHQYVYDFQVSEEGGHFTHATGIVISNTTSAVNLGAAINYFGGEVLIVDANLSTPNVGIHMNSPEVPINLNHVLLKKADPHEAIYEHESGLKIMPSSLSIKELKKVKPEKLKDLKDELKKLAEYVIVDSSAGLGAEAMAAIDLADEIIIVTNPELPAITDALKTIKIAEEMKTPVTGIIMSRVRGNKSEMQPESVKEMLETPVLGMIPEHIDIQRALNLKGPAVHTLPKSKPARAYKEIAARLLDVEYNSRKDAPSIFEILFKKKERI